MLLYFSSVINKWATNHTGKKKFGQFQWPRDKLKLFSNEKIRHQSDEFKVDCLNVFDEKQMSSLLLFVCYFVANAFCSLKLNKVSGTSW